MGGPAGILDTVGVAAGIVLITGAGRRGRPAGARAPPGPPRPPTHILLKTAGGAPPGRGKPVEEITDEEWRLGIDTNLSGTFYCCRAVIPHMLAQGGGKIINVTS